MSSRICFFTILAFNLLFFPLAYGQNHKDAKPELTAPATGIPAPAMALTDLIGREVDLGQQFGKVPSVLILWSIHSDNSVEEMEFFQKLEDKYHIARLAVAAVNEDAGVPIPRIRRFTDRLEKFKGKISYPLLYDESSRLMTSLAISTLPTVVFINRKGTITGYFSGFNPEDKTELARRAESLTAVEADAGEHAISGPEERIEYFTVTGKASLCGFFDSSGWRKSFSGNENLNLEMETTRDLARRAATRLSVTEALQRLGIEIYSRETSEGCLSPNGIQIGRDPFDTGDPMSNLLNLVNYDDTFETVQEQEALIDKTYYVTRRVKVYMDRLKDLLGSMDYLMTPQRIKVTYINTDPLKQKEFLSTLIANSRFLGNFEPPVSESDSMSQVFEIYTSTQSFTDEILDMDFGKLKVFVEQITPDSLELEIWR